MKLKSGNMLAKPDMTCLICKHNRTLQVLKEEITKIQQEIVSDWKASTIIQLDNHLFEDDGLEWYVLNKQGEATVIPSFSGFSKLMNKAFIVNPYEVDWELFDIHDEMDMDYILGIVGILQDQKDLWVNDETTRNTSLMISLRRFVRAITRLLVFTNALSYAI